jgi:beta-galactosidase
VIYGEANFESDKEEPQGTDAYPGLTGPDDDSGEMVFTTSADITAHGGGDNPTVSARRLELRPRFPTSGVRETWFTVGGHRVRVLAVSDEVADQTWFVPVGTATYVVVGVPYLGEAEMRSGSLHLAFERPYLSDMQGVPPMTPLVYPPNGAAIPLKEASEESSELNPPLLEHWAMRSGAVEAAPGTFTTRWKSSPSPLPMGADGDTSAYAWYRTSIFASRAGAYLLRCTDAGDWVAAWANGKPAGFSKVTQRFDHPQPREFPVTLHAGANSLALLCAHYGRHKLFNYLGPIDKIDAKGLCGPVTLSRQTASDVGVGGWRWRPWKAGDPTATLQEPLNLQPNPDAWSFMGAVGSPGSARLCPTRRAHTEPSFSRASTTTPPSGSTADGCSATRAGTRRSRFRSTPHGGSEAPMS